MSEEREKFTVALGRRKGNDIITRKLWTFDADELSLVKLEEDIHELVLKHATPE